MSDESYRPDWPPVPPPDDQPIPLSESDIALAAEDAAVMAELEKLQNKRPSWWSAIGLLIVSMLLFAGVSRGEEKWESFLFFIPVILFHELGHYVTMRVFGYRNLRMFFIPFFGAAVTGQHYNVAGWKRAVVALMGPLPGIVLAVPIGCAGMIAHQPYLLELAKLMLIVNGFNLLPFLPLDGGWIVHAILFVRHPSIDVAFRLFAALTMIAIAIPLHSWFLGIMGGLSLLGIPLAWRIAGIAYDLGQRGVVALSPDAKTIPLEAALPILGELRKALPPQTSPAFMAQHVANVFETLNAYPPGVLASIGLLALHAAAFVVTFVLTIVIMIAQRQLPG